MSALASATSSPLPRAAHALPLRAAGLSAMLVCCAGMVVSIRQPFPGPLCLYAFSSLVALARGHAPGPGVLAILVAALAPLAAYILGRRGWLAPAMLSQIVLHLCVIGYMLLHTPPAQRDATLLTSMPLAMAITFVLHDMLVSLERSPEEPPPTARNARYPNM